MHSLRVAIDGPAGAGKSTVARQLAKRLDLIYIDTGSMYRALTWLALSHGVRPGDEAAVVALLEDLSMDLKLGPQGEQRVWLNGKDVTDGLRTPEVDRFVSFVSSIRDVRTWMVNVQRKLAARGGVVMDGRDIGTHVMPDATVKVFLTASLEERARRRAEESRVKGASGDEQQILKALKERDYQDENREVSPARMADDAVPIDTTGKSVERVVEEIVRLCETHVKLSPREDDQAVPSNIEISGDKR